MATAEILCRFGHHPDAAIDFCIEVEVLQGMIFDVTRRLTSDDPDTLRRRIEVALSRQFLDQNARDAGRLLAAEGRKLLAFMGAEECRETARKLRDHRDRNGDCNAIAQAIFWEAKAAEFEKAYL